MTLDLDKIRARRDAYETDSWQRHRSCCPAHESAADVPALLAEVERLTNTLTTARDLVGTPGGDDRNDCLAVIDEIRRVLAEAAPR